MLCYQQRFISPTEPLTSDRFASLVVGDAVVKTISEVRQLIGAGQKNAAQQRKRTLPMIIWQATFEETVSKRGNRGRWRKQAAARLNGLYMVDIDHVEQPEQLFASWWKPAMDALLQDGNFHQNGEGMRRWAEALGVLLVHVTPSGHGLRLVAKASLLRGNLSDNQHWLCSQLGTECDEACKDASRTSFCPGFEDILYIDNQQLFNYENPEYDEKFGPEYRKGHSNPSLSPRQPAAAAGGGGAEGAAAAAAPCADGDAESAGLGGGADRQDGRASAIQSCSSWLATCGISATPMRPVWLGPSRSIRWAQPTLSPTDPTSTLLQLVLVSGRCGRARRGASAPCSRLLVYSFLTRARTEQLRRHLLLTTTLTPAAFCLFWKHRQGFVRL